MAKNVDLVGEPWTSFAAVVELIRSGDATSRPAIERVTGLGRSIVAERVGYLLEHGYILEDILAPSTGGRRARILRMNPDAGFILMAAFGVTSRGVGIANAAGEILHVETTMFDIADGPQRTLANLNEMFDRLLSSNIAKGPLWGIAVGLPGPIEVSTGKPSSPPMMPGWDGYDVAGHLARRYSAPVFIDNDVYLMALGEMRTGIAEAVDNFIFIKAGVGLGTAFISNGRAHRGANGLAGDIGHMTFDRKSSVVCRCGRLGCLEAIAGGYAVVRDARQAAESGASPALANALQTGGGLTLNDIVSIAERGDALTVALLDSAGQTLGRIVGDYVTLFNPSLVVVGGWMSEAEVLMSALRASAYESSEPRTTRDLRIVRSPSQSDLALRGALHLALDSIFTPQNLADWWGEHSE